MANTTGLDTYGVDSIEKLLSFFVVGEEGLARYLSSTRAINTDDRSRVPFKLHQDAQGVQEALDLFRERESVMPYLSSMDREERTRLGGAVRRHTAAAQWLTVGFLTGDHNDAARAELAAKGSGLGADQNVASALSADCELERYFARRVQTHVDDAGAHEAYARILWRHGRLDQALRHARDAMRLQPRTASPRLCHIGILLDRGAFSQALDVLDTLSGRIPSPYVLEQQRSMRPLIFALRRWRHQPDELRRCAEVAAHWERRREYARAAHMLESALADSGVSPALPLARLYESVGAFDTAFALYERCAHEGAGDNAREGAQGVSRLRGLVDEQQSWREWWAEAIPDASEPAPRSDAQRAYDRLHGMWGAYAHSEEPDSVFLVHVGEQLDRALAFEDAPESAIWYAAEFASRTDEYGRAARLWRRVEERSPADPYAANTRQRLDYLEQLARGHVRPGLHTDLLNRIGVLHWRSGEFEQAIRVLDQVLEQVPTNGEVWANLGQNYLEAGLPRKAAAAFEQALALGVDRELEEQILERRPELAALYN